MPCLHTLELRDVSLEPATAGLIAGHARLHCLHVPGTGFTDVEVALLAGAPSLQSLALDASQITDGSMAALAGAPWLMELYVYGPDLAAEVLDLVSRLTGLVDLNLMDAPLTEVMVTAMASLPRLHIYRAKAGVRPRRWRGWRSFVRTS